MLFRRFIASTSSHIRVRTICGHPFAIASNKLPYSKARIAFATLPRSFASLGAHKSKTPEERFTKMAQDVSKGLSNGLKYADVGINLGDPVYRGKYHGKKAHENDFDDVLERAKAAGCLKLMITGSDLKESQQALEIAKANPGFCYATVGVHPCAAKSFLSHPSGPDGLLGSIKELAAESRRSGHAVAFGEIGLDYDRLFLTDKETQLRFFEAQLDVAVELQMPLFLHSRSAAEDFEALLRPRLGRLPKRGLVHSFTGTEEEMRRLVDLGLDIGINGCSLKTEENLEVVRAIPLERLQLETDGPWCEIRPSHASSQRLQEGSAPSVPKAVKKEKWTQGCMVKGRNEPCTIGLVAHVVARVKNCTIEEVCEAAWANSVKMFGLGEEGEKQ